MIKRIFPWKYFLRLAARRYDFLDPISFLARLRSFAQPSEVQEPIELLRAGMVFHARGLLNTKAIQHNLDWVWPYWIVRQFNPADPSFIPRAFSFSHVNLTHRNWTAVGLPNWALYPIVDPHGLITPQHDGWSIDFWFYGKDKEAVFPSRLEHVEQSLIDDDNRRVMTEWSSDAAKVHTAVCMEEVEGRPTVCIEATAEARDGGWLVAALRPYNPEGIQFIESASTLDSEPGWVVNNEIQVLFSETPEKMLYSTYHEADVSSRLDEDQSAASAECRVGMTTAAAFFAIPEKKEKAEITIRIPLKKSSRKNSDEPMNWTAATQPAAQLQVPDARIKFLYSTAIRTLIHLAADDIVPGPYTYNRFWFRDACLMLHPMLAVGLHARCRIQLDRFAARQKADGFFHSQAGEWDANGQVLWIYNRYRRLTGGEFNPDWLKAIKRGSRWIARKRVKSARLKKYIGLLPAGFSAEHFGPNDYYYWDDFWALAGLYGAAAMLDQCGSPQDGRAALNTAREMEQSIYRSLTLIMEEKQLQSMPVSPNRRMDSGAIGSLAADYPLQLFVAGDQRTMATADFLMENCLHHGCFFQDMIHSGINIYMTLMLAQVFLRAGDPRFFPLLSRAADFASPTGQWPEAIHPITGGGCMGDGQHGWAAAEWVMLLRNMFVFEEDNRLYIGKGIRPEWLLAGVETAFGPTLTPYGSVRVTVKCDEEGVEAGLTGDWYEVPRPEIVVTVPGWKEQQLEAPDYRCRLVPEK